MDVSLIQAENIGSRFIILIQIVILFLVILSIDEHNKPRNRRDFINKIQAHSNCFTNHRT